MKPLGLKLETELFKSGYSVVVGCDEVGRGALAGPIVAAAVAFGDKYKVESEKLKVMRKVQDSKLLKVSDREELAIHIKQNCLAWSVASVSPGVIDKINIHQANLLAFYRAVQLIHKKLDARLRKKADVGARLACPIGADSFGRASFVTTQIHILVDGRFNIPSWSGSQEAVINGDAKVFSIAAASIIAKVYRDQLMMKLDEKFPGYELAIHKGYGTPRHRQNILKHGLSNIHRKTFCGNIDSWRSKTV